MTNAKQSAGGTLGGLLAGAGKIGMAQPFRSLRRNGPLILAPLAPERRRCR